MSSPWNNELAKFWDSFYPPVRPSKSELKIYADIIKEMKKKLNRQLNILILGSTIELRELAFKENLNVTVIDNNEEYYKAVSKHFKNKKLLEKEQLVTEKWENMNYEDKFDIIIGDSYIGNIRKDRVELFLKKANRALKEKGILLGKNFYISSDYQKKEIIDIVQEYQNNYSDNNPFSCMIYNLTMSSLKNNIIDFIYIFTRIKKQKNNFQRIV